MPSPSRLTLLFLCLPAVIQSFMHGPAAAVLQGVYAKHVGMSLAALGTAILVARVFDALTDPLIGYLSDRTQERFGTRKPWLVAGMVVSVVSTWSLYRPPEEVSAFWFTGWFVATYLGWTLIEIPYRSWSMELSTDPTQRTRIMTWVAVGTGFGGITFFLMPYLQRAMGLVENTELTLVTLAGSAVVVAVALPLAVLVAVAKVPDAQTSRVTKSDSAGQLFQSIFQNGPLLYVTLLFLFMGITAGMGAGLLYLYIDVYLGLGEQLAGLLLLAGPLVLVSMPMWGWAAIRFERHHVLAVAVALQALCSLMFAFIPAGGDGFWVLLPVMILNIALQGAGVVIFPAMMGDVADYGRHRFGHDRTGIYYAFFTMVQKAVGGLGVSLGLFTAAYFGFDATSATQTESGVLGMKVSMAYVPALAALIAVPMMWRFPLNRARHAEIRAALEPSSAESR